MMIRLTILFLFCSNFLFGCISYTSFSVEKVESNTNPEGIRYYLPAPYLMVTPKTSGEVDVDIVMLPDPKNQYAIDVDAYMGNYTIDINRSKEGFLETVTLNSDSTGLAKSFIESAGNLRAAEIEVEGTAKTAEEEDTKGSIKAEKLALVAAEQTVKDTNLALEIAQRKVEILLTYRSIDVPPEGTLTLLVEAELALAEAQVNQRVALEALLQISEEADAANSPIEKGKPLSTPAPVFYRISMSESSVELIVDEPQKDLETWKVPKESSKTEVPDVDISFAAGSSKYVRPSKDSEALAFTMSSNRKLTSVNPTGDIVVNDDKYEFKTTLLSGKTLVVFDLPKELPNGEYTLNFIVSFDKKDKEDFSINIVVEK